MNLFPERTETHGHSKRTYGHQRGTGRGAVSDGFGISVYSPLRTQQISNTPAAPTLHTPQQAVTGQGVEIYTAMTESLDCTKETNPTLPFPGHSDSKESACNAGDPGSIPGLGRSPGEGSSYPLQYSCLENPMDRGAWWATAHGLQRVGHD